jgi:hypothetical protein
VSTDDLHYGFETWFLSYQESYSEELENSSKISSVTVHVQAVTEESLSQRMPDLIENCS